MPSTDLFITQLLGAFRRMPLCVALVLFFAAPAAAQSHGNVWEGVRDLVVIDPGVPEPEVLLSDGGDYEVLRLGEGDDALEAIATAMKEMGGAGALHLVSHGANGGLFLGGVWIDQQALLDRRDTLAQLRDALQGDGVIRLYGCEVAAGERGRDFVDTLAELSGASVAASSSLTGHADLGGNWDLDYVVGEVLAGNPFSAQSLEQYRYVLAHNRGGSMAWQAKDITGDGQKNDVEITVNTAWTGFDSGVPLTASPSLSFTQVSETYVFVNGTNFSDSDYVLKTTIYHATNLDPNTRYLVSTQSCCRIGGLVNNASSNYRLETEIFLKDGNLAPKIDLPIIFQVPQQKADGSTLEDWTFMIPSSDPNADKLRYRLATTAEFGGGSQTNPAGLSINPNTGVITWTGSGNLSPGLYSAGFVAEDLDENGNRKSKTHVDLILELVNKRQVAFSAGGVSETSKVFVRKGETFILEVAGEGGAAIDTQSLGIIQGALTELSANEFQFEPGPVGTGLDPGIYPIVFEVRDQSGVTGHNYLIVNFIVPDDDAPWIDNLEGIRTPYSSTEAELVGDPLTPAAVTYTTNPTLNGGMLKFNVTFVDGEFEILSMRAQGDDSGEVNLVGNQVFYEGNLIGVVHPILDGVGRALQIDFTTDDATVEAVEAVVQNLTYEDTFTLREVGDRALSVYLRDQDGRANSYDFFVEVAAHPDMPTESGPPVMASNRITVVEGETAALSDEDIKFADVDGRPITFDVVSIERGRFVYVSNPGVAITSFTQQEISLGSVAFAYVDDASRLAPSYSLTATAGSDTSAVSVGNVTFTNANLHTPVISGSPPTTVNALDNYSFIPTATDNDLDFGDQLTFSITNKPAWASFNSATGELSGQPAAGDVGDHAGIVITVTDSGGLSHSLSTFTITVDIPIDLTVTEPGTPHTFTFGGDPADVSVDGGLRRNGSDSALVGADMDAVLTVHGDGNYTFTGGKTGRYTFTLTDSVSGNVIKMAFDIHPFVAFSSEQQPGNVGTSTKATLWLSDLPIQWPVRIDYDSEGLTVGEATPIEIQEVDGLRKDVAITPLGGAWTTYHIELLAAGIENARLGTPDKHRVKVQTAVVPLSVSLTVDPGRTIALSHGAVLLEAHPSGGGYTYDWSSSDGPLGISGQTGSDVSFDTGTLAPGLYTARVTVTETGTGRSGTSDVALRVVTSTCPAGLTCSGSKDSGIPPSPELDPYLDEIAKLPICPALGDNMSTNRINACRNQNGHQPPFMETVSLYDLRLGVNSGDESWESGQFGLGVEQLPADPSYVHLGFRTDFEISGLEVPGVSVPVVIPLPAGEAIPANAVWRKLRDGVWGHFVVDDGNRIHSAGLNAQGHCPGPSSDAWSPGLWAGDRCVLLMIEDGGPNDQDGQANRIIRDPGTLAVPAGSVITSGGGGGAVGPFTLLLGALIAVGALVRRRAAAPMVALSLLSGSFAVNAENGWYLGGHLGQARGEVSSADVNTGLTARGIDGTGHVSGKDRTGGRLFGGYQFSPYLGVEGGYTDLGKARTRVDLAQVQTLESLRGALPASGRGMEAALIGMFPLNDRFEVYGRAGLWHWKARYHVNTTGESRTITGTSGLIGLGVQAGISDQWQLRIGADRYRIDGQSVDLFGVGVVYRLH